MDIKNKEYGIENGDTTVDIPLSYNILNSDTIEVTSNFPNACPTTTRYTRLPDKVQIESISITGACSKLQRELFNEGINRRRYLYFAD